MTLLTTTIGAYPKPSYVKVIDWFDASRRGEGMYTFDWVQAYEKALKDLGDNTEEVFARGTKEVVQDQLGAGIDILTDGEVRRENYIHYHCRHLNGVDFEKRTRMEFRPSFFGHVPTITGPISAQAPFLLHDWKVAQSFTDKPMKMTMPGPVTIGNACYDDHYGNDRDARKKRGADIADALNREIRTLAEGGCKYVQVDEPGFARRPEDALDFGFENLERVWHNVPDSVVRTVHICCGYPNKLDNPGYPKADNDIYKKLAALVEDSSIQAISIEDAHRHNDLALLQTFQATTVILGTFDISMSRVETVDEIEQRLREALRYIDADRLIAAPDCGLGLLVRELAIKKMKNMTEAATRVG